jgi:hypothetical protein
MSQDANTPPHTWARRRVDAIRKGQIPEPVTGPLQPWEEHAAHLRERVSVEGHGTAAYCNTCGVGLVAPGTAMPTAEMPPMAPALGTIEIIARTALHDMPHERRLELFAEFGCYPSDHDCSGDD